eukprot:gene7694-9006_t
MNIKQISLVQLLLCLGSLVAIDALTCTSIQQYNITYTFNKAYTCGQFVNGDYWVKPSSKGGKVIINSISPPFNGSVHGWQVNPWNNPAHLLSPQQGFDYEIYDFNASLVPSLPYSASANSSIVKSISQLDGMRCSNHEGCLLTASVLTVVDFVPSSTSFRPNYYGSQKRFYKSDNIQSHLLLSLLPVDDTPSIQSLEQRFQRVYLDHIPFSSTMHPTLNMASYGSDIVSDTGDAVLRLNLNESPAAKRKLLINYIQVGIDYIGMFRQGRTWHTDGGINSGRKLPIVFASVMLNDTETAYLVGHSPLDTFQEDGQVYWSPNASQVLFGRSNCNEADNHGYWYNQQTGNGGRDCRDPFGYIDGGQKPGEWYQACCTSMSWKSTALSLRLIPQLQCTFNYDYFAMYVDRWVSFGAWTLPDPISSNGTPGPSRYGDLHGTNANWGFYVSGFSNSMWSAYRTLPTNITCGSSNPTVTPLPASTPTPSV